MDPRTDPYGTISRHVPGRLTGWRRFAPWVTAPCRFCGLRWPCPSHRQAIEVFEVRPPAGAPFWARPSGW